MSSNANLVNTIMLTESVFNPKANREKMASVMFEKFKVPALYIANSAPLSIYASRKFSGLICESGEGVTQLFPIFDSEPLHNSTIRLNFAGREITKLFQRLLPEIGLCLTTSGEFEITRTIKEKLCYVALDFEEEKKTYNPEQYALPDGQNITLDSQMFRAPEILFNPGIIGKEEKGFADSCFDSIESSSSKARKDLYENIILSGGTTMLRGFPERLEKELKELVPESMKPYVKVIVPPERNYATWIGGSVLSSISTFENEWITKEQYNENGVNIVHKNSLWSKYM